MFLSLGSILSAPFPVNTTVILKRYSLLHRTIKRIKVYIMPHQIKFSSKLKITLYLLLSFTLFQTAWSQGEKKKLIDSALKYIDGHNYGKAINIYNSILAAEPKNAHVYELRGFAYQEMKDYESAFRDYCKSVVADTGYCLGYLRRGDLLAFSENFDDAVIDYDVALRFADSNTLKETILVNRAQAKRRMRNPEDAVADLKKVLEFNPTSIGALVNLGALLPDIGQVQEAISCLEKVIMLDSTFEGGYGNLAFLYSEIREYKKALQISDALISFKPNEAFALNNRGYIKYKLNDLTGALEDINNSISISPGNSYAFRNRGLVYIAMKKNSEACADFNKSLNLGFLRQYGNEVDELIKIYCKKADPVQKL
jgi:tetratricopeptide (TPR) repeat protein